MFSLPNGIRAALRGRELADHADELRAARPCKKCRRDDWSSHEADPPYSLHRRIGATRTLGIRSDRYLTGKVRRSRRSRQSRMGSAMPAGQTSLALTRSSESDEARLRRSGRSRRSPMPEGTCERRWRRRAIAISRSEERSRAEASRFRDSACAARVSLRRIDWPAAATKGWRYIPPFYRRVKGRASQLSRRLIFGGRREQLAGPWESMELSSMLDGGSGHVLDDGP